ncbi:hypothetical protein OIU84_006729 [Salix udensis]|uniref:LysM domain-containing protein n=1 Tax=Salix udensis TaxID=889485 RepID=A0AAD6JZ13_9ROSI|nr:hypothetical protein OIU84_006729 [Salix udensis]
MDSFASLASFTCRDILVMILRKLGARDLSRASCVCKLWRDMASDDAIVSPAFMEPWKLKEIVGKPVSGSFWRENGIWRFAISHKIVRGDSVTSLAKKYSFQVMDVKRLNSMMSDHDIYSKERLLIPIINPNSLINGTCYIELDTYAKGEVEACKLKMELRNTTGSNGNPSCAHRIFSRPQGIFALQSTQMTMLEHLTSLCCGQLPQLWLPFLYSLMIPRASCVRILQICKAVPRPERLVACNSGPVTEGIGFSPILDLPFRITCYACLEFEKSFTISKIANNADAPSMREKMRQNTSTAMPQF